MGRWLDAKPALQIGGSNPAHIIVSDDVNVTCIQNAPLIAELHIW
jgi:hypothetical protein